MHEEIQAVIGPHKLVVRLLSSQDAHSFYSERTDLWNDLVGAVRSKLKEHLKEKYDDNRPTHD